MKSFMSQFGRPQGLLGRIVGVIMAYENRQRNRWAVSLLGIQPTDRVLEVGFGPGLAIEGIARLAERGFVAGVDFSEVMVQQARKRNSAAIRARRVQLKLGAVSALPYGDGTFDKGKCQK